MINDDVRLVVLSVSAGGVRLGIEAPREVVVHREEVYQRMQETGSNTVSLNAKGVCED